MSEDNTLWFCVLLGFEITRQCMYMHRHLGIFETLTFDLTGKCWKTSKTGHIDLIIYVMLQHVVTAFRWGFSSQVFWSLISLLSVICVWNTSASTQHTQITHAAFAGLLWWSHILSEGEVKMSGPWELVTVSRWLNDRVVHCNCHSIITILHKQGQLRTDKKRQKQEHWRLGSLTTNYLSSILTLHRFLSLDPGRNSTS